MVFQGISLGSIQKDVKQGGWEYPCRTPTVVLNQSPMLPLKMTSLVALSMTRTRLEPIGCRLLLRGRLSTVPRTAQETERKVERQPTKHGRLFHQWQPRTGRVITGPLHGQDRGEGSFAPNAESEITRSLLSHWYGNSGHIWYKLIIVRKKRITKISLKIWDVILITCNFKILMSKVLFWRLLNVGQDKERVLHCNVYQGGQIL